MPKLPEKEWPAGPPPSIDISDTMTPKLSQAVLARSDNLHVQLARQTMSGFITYVMKDEMTGRALEMAPIHRAWHSAAEEHKNLLIWAHIEAGKSTQLSVARSLWLLGRDPTLRGAIVSNTAKQSEKLLRAISKYIETSAPLHKVFPDLLPGDTWSNNNITVKRPFVAKDPSIQATGIHGSIVGSRLDFVVLDDVLDYENTRTAALREDTWAWIQSSVLSRLSARARVLCVGTAFHPDDALHRLARMPGVKAYVYPVLDEAGNPRWPQRWPLARIEEAKVRLGPLEFARQLLCKARSDEESRFKQEWIDVALRNGDGRSLAYSLERLPPGYKTYTGVDLAVQRKDSSDLTCFFTIAVAPDGQRHVLGLETGKFTGPTIIEKIVEQHKRYQSICVVENNAAQDYIVQFARGQFAVPIRPFTTGRNKAHPEFGIESLAAEFAGGKWSIPSIGGRATHPEVQAWLQEMLYYSPAAHTGDRLMASWFAREGARLGALNVQRASIDVVSR